MVSRETLLLSSPMITNEAYPNTAPSKTITFILGLVIFIILKKQNILLINTVQKGPLIQMKDSYLIKLYLVLDWD